MNKKANALLIIGKVTGVHGLQGKLKIWSFADSIETFACGRKVWLRCESLEKIDSHQNASIFFIIKAVSEKKKGLLLTLEGINNRESAEALIGYSIFINRDQLDKLDQDTWYWQDLYGLNVIDQHRGFLGIIDSIFPTGADDILVIKNKENGQEVLIPMHRQFIVSVDIKYGQVKTMLPEGL